jgi:hypothetical protein
MTDANYRNFQIQVQNGGYAGYYALILFRGGCESSTRYYESEEKALDKAKEKIDCFCEDGEWPIDI